LLIVCPSALTPVVVIVSVFLFGDDVLHGLRDLAVLLADNVPGVRIDTRPRGRVIGRVRRLRRVIELNRP